MGKRTRESFENETLPPTTKQQEEVASLDPSLPTLPWMRKPLIVDSFPAVQVHQLGCLDPRLISALQDIGIESLFPVQVAVWQQVVGLGGGERDICVCSPTGSGKTLAYALPIVQMLSTRVVRRLRALVVLPTRDLAVQVKAVFDTIASAVGLSVGLAIGQTQIANEAAELVELPRKCVHHFSTSEVEMLDFPSSRIDILVATPGRLMDHITSTEGFTLEHLRYMVIDESDRLLRQAYQDWLPHSLERIFTKGQSKQSLLKGLGRGFGMANHYRAMKMVVSATLTRDPAKISQLKLCFPLLISANVEEKRYQLPKQLQSYKMVTELDKKPLHLMVLLQMLEDQKTIVFTASVTSTHRLFLLLQCCGTRLKAVEYSSLQHQHDRSKALAAFREGDAKVLIASDAITRGMDVEGVMNVINYDVPVYAKTYVHRVGRTARAGKPGSSYTLLRREEVRHFKEMLQKVENSKCKRFKLPQQTLDELYPCYIEGLNKLKEVTVTETIKV
ncbi:hypothetical protein KP509_16G062700 [Ceratopteris richardii]|uniref:ATP-dependent RNA helicase n=1 Tax=Ceratopteris richardii TaxID=49495 RepID=A0A8T2T308_CERRI|nr:hypothetical protein KP509_16G062700 [Ceratopteris richardii]